MSVELGPRGTKGVEFPKPLRPLMSAGMGLSHRLFKILGSRMKIQGRPLLLLKTVGARTGKPREAILAHFPDRDRDDTWLVVASAGGSARHPGWSHNLRKNPDQVRIETGGAEYKVRPESLKGSERDEAWRRVVSMAPGYGRYETKTDRQIPIIRLIKS